MIGFSLLAILESAWSVISMRFLILASDLAVESPRGFR